jgi:polysaccharide export outer membrane protein
MIRKLSLILLMPVFLLGGCASHEKEYMSLPVHSTFTATAPEARNDLRLEPYRIQIGDVLDIRLYLNPELNDEVTVRPDGMISTSLVQDVMAYGQTPGQLQQALTAAYKASLSDPKLTVMVRSFAPQRIYVLGEVTTPSELVYIGPSLTVLQAIARAGGMRNSADTAHVLILHRGAGDVEKVYIASYDAATMGQNGNDSRLAPDDIVFVPRTGVADSYLYYQQHLQQFLPPSFGLGYQLNPGHT